MKPRTVEEWRVVLDLIDAFLKRLREADSDERLRMLEEGKQPRPAAEEWHDCQQCGGMGGDSERVCPGCNGCGRAKLVSPAAHTAQVTATEIGAPYLDALQRADRERHLAEQGSGAKESTEGGT